MEQELQALAEQVAALDEQSAVSVICSVLESRPELAPSVVSFSVPDLTYPPIKAMIERRSTGYIKSFNLEKGFGFISCEELYKVFGNDVFLVGQQMGQFQVGEEVSFAVALNKDNKPQAYDLRNQRNAHHGGKGHKGASAWVPQQHQQQQQAQSWGGGGGWGKAQGSWPVRVPPPQRNADAQGGWGQQALVATQPAIRPAVKRKSDEAFNSPDKVVGDYQGFIKSFNDKNGYGFIACEALQQEGYHNDVFLHHAQYLNSGFEVGSEVEFTVFMNHRNQPQAKDLRAPGGSANAESWE